MILGEALFFYANKLPYHKGKYRLLCLLDSLFGPFSKKNRHLGMKINIYFSSFMDSTYFLNFDQHREGSPTLHSLILDEIMKLKPGDNFLDVGANIGFFSLLASRQVGPSGAVVSVEPSSREYVRLLQHIRENEVKNIIPLHLGFSDRSGVETLNLPDRHTGANYLGKVDRLSKGLRQEKIACFPGSALLANLLPRLRFDLVKIDVEGAELFVLRGLEEMLARAPAKKILVEITPDFLENFGHRPGDIYALLERLGYKPRFGLGSFRYEGSLRQYDEIFSL